MNNLGIQKPGGNEITVSTMLAELEAALNITNAELADLAVKLGPVARPANPSNASPAPQETGVSVIDFINGLVNRQRQLTGDILDLKGRLAL